MITIGNRGGNVGFLVEAKRSFSAADAQRLLDGVARMLRAAAGSSLLVISDWLSPRAQQLLREQGISYLDLTGNAYIRSEHPAVFVRCDGANRNPSPPQRAEARLTGSKAWRLIRMLLDVVPPYSVRELAQAAGINPGYVSRLLSVLEDEALIDRAPTGGVASVAVVPLVRKWSETYDVLKSNTPGTFLAPDGAVAAFERLRALSVAEAIAVTGSFAASRLAPVAGATTLMAYTEEPAAVAREMNLLPTDRRGANIALLLPYDPAVWQQTMTDAGITYAAPSQVAVDCLTGPGRMPAEGDALLEWMAVNDDWRLSSLAEFARRTSESSG